MISPRIKAIHEFMGSSLKIFNFVFFVASVVFWLFLVIKNVLLQPLQLSTLWSAFSDMYAQYSFKVGCIFLIFFNGLAAIRGFFSQYVEIAESVEHGHRVRKFLGRFLGRGG